MTSNTSGRSTENSSSAETFIYAIECKEGKFYIGKSTDPFSRLRYHRSGDTEWTRRYFPMELRILADEADGFDEQIYTLRYMEKYGIDNVRGGSYCKLELSSDQRAAIEDQLTSATDRCYKCNKNGHFARNCNNINERVSGRNKDMHEDSFCRSSQPQSLKRQRDYSHVHEEKATSSRACCSRCRRAGHTEKSCYAKTDVNGNQLPNTNNQYKKSVDSVNVPAMSGRPQEHHQQPNTTELPPQKRQKVSRNHARSSSSSDCFSDSDSDSDDYSDSDSDGDSDSDDYSDSDSDSAYY
jgi:hypothetical protein